MEDDQARCAGVGLVADSWTNVNHDQLLASCVTTPAGKVSNWLPAGCDMESLQTWSHFQFVAVADLCKPRAVCNLRLRSSC